VTARFDHDRPLQRLLTTKEAAAYIGAGADTLARWHADGSRVPAPGISLTTAARFGTGVSISMHGWPCASANPADLLSWAWGAMSLF
jgi:hypothetical protein